MSDKAEKMLDELSWQTRITMIAGTSESNVPLLLVTAILTPTIANRLNPHLIGPVNIKKTGTYDLATGLEIGRVWIFEMRLEDGVLGKHWARTPKYLGTTLEFRDLFRRLADTAKLSDADRLEMFTEISKFIGKDERAVSDLGGNLKEI